MLERTERLFRIRSIYPRTPKIPFLIGGRANMRSMQCENLIFRTAFAELRRSNISFVMYVRPSLSHLYILMN